MKILITGAAGFIGLNLVKFFLSKDYTVIGDYGYDYDAARKAVDEANKNLFSSLEKYTRQVKELKSKNKGSE